MPLSEEEKRLLEQMEAALAADDPKLASTLRGSVGRRAVHRRRAALAGVGFFLGLGLLLGGLQIHPVVSVAGFVVMLAATIVALGAWEKVTTDDAPTAPGNPPRSARTPSGSDQGFMDRMEDRWRRRQQGE